MRKAFEPRTITPGAVRQINPDTLLPAVDAKGKPLFDLPQPIRFAEHTRRRKIRGKVVTDKVKVPVYRGVPASLANHIRGQMKRTRRKAVERAAEKAALMAKEKANE